MPLLHSSPNHGEQAHHYTTDVVMPLLHSSPKRGEQAYHYTTDVVMPLLHSSPKTWWAGLPLHYWCGHASITQ